MSDFGDIERADTWDADPTIAPEQVTYRIHKLRAQIDALGGRNTPKYADLTDVEQELALAIGGAVVRWVIASEPDSAGVIAERIHNVRVYLSRGVVDPWDELSPDERQISIDLVDLVLDWLEKEGAAVTGIYYVEAADWLRAIGITVVETDDWETRARSSGGFAKTPLGVQWHHTAGNMNLQSNIAWMTENSDDAPIGNILLWNDGVAYMIAAGASNTAGKGGPWPMSRGTVPLDQGNSTTWAIEAANDGVGQKWPAIQVDAFHAINNELNRRWGNKPTDLFTHAAYAPSRKVDPATAAAVQGGWKPRSVNSSGTWSVDDVKSEAGRRAGSAPPQPTPTPPTPGPPSDVEDDDMLVVALDANGSAWVGNGVTRLLINSDAVFQRYILVHGKRFVNTSGQVVSGWQNVGTADNDTLAALGFGMTEDRITEMSEPSGEGSRLTNDPVRIVWVCYGFIQAVLIALMAAGVVSTRVSAAVTGVALACYVAVSELFVRPETVPRAELTQTERLAHPK